jgi:hypothetical protein
VNKIINRNFKVVGVHVENLSINWKVLFENRTLNVEGMVLTVFVHLQDRVQWRAFVNSGMNVLDPEKRD